MEVHKNDTFLTEFILLGLTTDPAFQIPLFLLFLQVYTFTLFINVGIVVLITVSPQLNGPMYFLLGNLSFVDLCNSSTIMPNMLIHFISRSRMISFGGCISQLFFFLLFGNIDGLLLAVMAFDRYHAICNPLHYSAIITKHICILLVTGAFASSLVISLVITCGVFKLKFCGPNIIAHFYCDLPPLFKLSCSDTTINEIVVFALASTVQGGSILVVVISYIYIIITIIGIHSSEGRSKAFSTCSSHFFCVTLFYFPAFFMYLKPSSSYSTDQDRVASLFYTVFVPMLNPLIYSLRNKTMMEALRQVIRQNLAQKLC